MIQGRIEASGVELKFSGESLKFCPKLGLNIFVWQSQQNKGWYTEIESK